MLSTQACDIRRWADYLKAIFVVAGINNADELDEERVELNLVVPAIGAD